MRVNKQIIFAAFATSLLAGPGLGDSDQSGSGGHHAAPVPPEDQLTAFENPKPAMTKEQWEAMSKGQQVYERWCSHCHDPGTGPHPGTQMLALSRGSEYSVIKENDYLPPDYIKTVVRNGLQMMPPFRTTDISDDELEALADYLGKGE